MERRGRGGAGAGADRDRDSWRSAPADAAVGVLLVGPHHLLRPAAPTVMHRSRLSLPRAAVRRLARRGGVSEFAAEECTYVSSGSRGSGGFRGGVGSGVADKSEWVRRTVRGAWLGEVERARSSAALGLQLRALDAHVQWDGLKRPAVVVAAGTKIKSYKSKKAAKAEKAALQALMLQVQERDREKGAEKEKERERDAGVDADIESQSRATADKESQAPRAEANAAVASVEEDALPAPPLPLHIVRKRLVMVEATGEVVVEYQLAGGGVTDACFNHDAAALALVAAVATTSIDPAYTAAANEVDADPHVDVDMDVDVVVDADDGAAADAAATCPAAAVVAAVATGATAAPATPTAALATATVATAAAVAVVDTAAPAVTAPAADAASPFPTPPPAHLAAASGPPAAVPAPAAAIVWTPDTEVPLYLIKDYEETLRWTPPQAGPASRTGGTLTSPGPGAGPGAGGGKASSRNADTRARVLLREEDIGTHLKVG